ncbi:hypothetical protein GO988_18440 [Hymenobacter sp. HMF4947]|uniref:Uncharacterized protein n=1 Tax=Hymenobacter ginkgonis TaxID=2682976 RepID=A0A7K1TIW7_9BACT|nr:hypothetical protein [Hymenobacter ginkgonis]MVN78313.1 hypothetical protein [Hymenobacter ginkgonis]
MPRLLLLLLLALLSLADGPAAVGAPAAGHHPRYTAYKHRGDARKRWRRMGVIGRWRYRQRFKRKQQLKGHRGVIRVGKVKGSIQK